MCSFFGEVNIPSSRAFWDDCDEEELDSIPESKKLELLFGDADRSMNSGSYDLFLLLEGRDIADFAKKTLLKDALKLCTIPTEKNHSGLYLNKEKNLLIGILEEDLTNSGEITNLLIPYAKDAKNVMTFSFKRKIDYKSENINEVKDKITFLRAINSRLSYVKELEQPNFICGVSAGIATWRENEKLQVSSYIIYTDASGLDATSAKPILKSFQDLKIDCASKYEKQYKDESWLYT